MDDERERMHILEMIESGKISASQGVNLLQALATREDLTGEEETVTLQLDRRQQQGVSSLSLNPIVAGQADEPFLVQDLTGGMDTTGEPPLAGEAVPEPAGNPWESDPPGTAALPFDVDKWRRWWMIPLWVGVAVTILGGLLMFWALQASGVSFWLFFAGVPFLLGVALIVLSWQSRTAHWLHLRVEQKTGEWPQHIAISFPLPLHFSAWVVRNFGHRIPNIQGASFDEIILSLGKSASPENPLSIEVEEGENGERVQIFIT